VVRFDRARRRLLWRQAKGGRVVLAGFAAECGYYDQAHLARDFRELAGCPPSVLLAEELPNVQAGLQAAGNDGHMTETKAPPPPSVWPTLRANDAHGAKVTHELYDTCYGSRDFAIEDPEGNHWAFGTYPGAPGS
jgi:hypothetical protein